MVWFGLVWFVSHSVAFCVKSRLGIVYSIVACEDVRDWFSVGKRNTVRYIFSQMYRSSSLIAQFNDSHMSINFLQAS